MTPLYSATLEPAWRAVVVSRRPLLYADGADAHADRPAHVRAGSSLAWLGDSLALVQDDANFIALVSPASATARAITLPRGVGGLRQFDDTRGNKHHKLDLEACVAIDGDEGPTLLAFGSGSGALREQIVMLDGALGPSPRIQVMDASPLYAALRAHAAFAGSDMNVEGAMLRGDTLSLLARGNGAARNGEVARNATCDLDARALLAWLRTPHGPAPRPERIVQYDLGMLDGIALGFTDAAARGQHALYTAAAEDSPDATRDGVVTGSVIGVMPLGGGLVRHVAITAADGSAFAEKVEGIALHQLDARRVYLVIDSDDPARPSALCEVALEGDWEG